VLVTAVTVPIDNRGEDQRIVETSKHVKHHTAQPNRLLTTAKADIPKSPVRILVVDDFEPWRQHICSTLKARQELQVVGEAFDGLEAVHKAEGLKPDLILLDIGLPNLNGIVVARQIRKLAPESKIIFVSQESSPDVVQEALNLGALGYVLKVRAGTDLLAAVEAVLEGRQFVSGVLSGQLLTDTSPVPPGVY
jgi:DNA-binding NarL/FixJ family response regulator